MTQENVNFKSFIKKRLHSLTGLFLVLFLIEHLFVNSQAALFVGEDGLGFVKAVDAIHSFPYLPLIEITLLGVPILLHGWWGIQTLRTSAINSFSTDQTKVSLPEYKRNRAYTWQRLTSWILLFGIVGHVIQMRFVEYPWSVKQGETTYYMLPLNRDEGLATLSKRLGFEVYDREVIAYKEKENKDASFSLFSQVREKSAVLRQTAQQEEAWLALLTKPLKENQLMAVTSSFGLAELLLVRETFKMPLMIALYTLFVLAACFHGFNGLWTFMITWGVTLTAQSQRYMLWLAYSLMALLASGGLMAIWGTYWINLRQ